VDYINSINDVDKIKNIFFKSDKYTLDANDFYFGIGLSGLNNSNLTNLSFFEFGLKYKNVDEYGNITSSKILPLLPCQPRYFFTRKDWEETDLDKRSFLNNSMKTYLSQDLNYSADLIPFQYKEEYSYVELYIKAQDKYQVKNALSFINTYKPKIEFVWSAISIHSDNKDEPFEAYIDFYTTNFHNEEIQELDVFLQPINIYDDDYPVTSGYRSFIVPRSSNQPNGEIFNVVNMVYSSIQLQNREDINILTEDDLYFIKIKIKLSQTGITIYRDYQKFIDWLAGATAFTSNILFITMIVIEHINSLLAKNVLLRTFFNIKTVEKIGKYQHEIKNILKIIAENHAAKKKVIYYLDRI